MIKSQFQTLFAYHWHTNRTMMQKAATLDEAVYKDNPGYGHGSIHDLLFHILRTDRSWRMALETGRQAAGMRPEVYSDLKSLQAGFEEEQAAWRAVIDGLSDEEIESEIALTNWRGEPFPISRWVILQHLVLHGMQHQTEVAQLLTARGQSPGDIDFIFFS